MGFWLGHTRRAPTPSPRDAGVLVSSDRGQDAGLTAAQVRVDLGAPIDAGPRSAADLGPPGSTPGTLPSICVQVQDVGERRVAGALVTWRSVVPNSLRPTREVGELGVYSGPLPFPEDVILRTGPLAPRSPSPGAASAAATPAALRTDASGRACLRASGHLVITAVLDERSASVELDVPADAQPAGVVVLRLGIPAEALCRLATPADTGEPGAEPVSSQPGGEIEGRVIDARGFGIAGVRIDAQVGSSQAVAVSDARGGFRLAGLPLGSLQIRAQKRGYAPFHSSRRADEPRSDVQVTLQPGGGIAGVLRDRARGLVPAGASLSLQHAGSSQVVPLSREGQFSVTGLTSGSAVLRARAPGFAPLSLPIEIPAGQSPDEITLRDLRLELEPGATVSGRVLGSRGSPAGVSVSALAEDGSVVSRALSDDRGEFQLTDLPAGSLRVSATAGSLRGSVRVQLQPGQRESIQIEIQE